MSGGGEEVWVKNLFSIHNNDIEITLYQIWVKICISSLEASYARGYISAYKTK